MRSTIVRRSAALALLLGAAIIAKYLASGWRGWTTPAHLVVTGLLGVTLAATTVALWRGSPHRRPLGGILLLTGCALVLFGAPRVLVVSASSDPRAYTAMLAAMTFLSGLGVLLRSRAARWLALGGAAAGAMSSGLNLAQWMSAGVVDHAGWALAIWTLGSAMVLALLAGPTVAAGDRSREAHDEVWTRRDPLVRWMRASVVAGVAASMMLLVYATVQHDVVEALVAPAVALAVLLLVAAGLSARGKVVGGVLMTACAVGLFALSAVMVSAAPASAAGLRVPAYYLLFWLPACVCGLGCGVALLRVTIARSASAR